jgi:hypothetical protein
MALIDFTSKGLNCVYSEAGDFYIDAWTSVNSNYLWKIKQEIFANRSFAKKRRRINAPSFIMVVIGFFQNVYSFS